MAGKPQKVTPKVNEEQTLKVKMPQGSTERNKKLIAKQKQVASTAAGKQLPLYVRVLYSHAFLDHLHDCHTFYAATLQTVLGYNSFSNFFCGKHYFFLD